MAKYLNLDGLQKLWDRLIKYHPYKWDSYVSSDRYYTNIFSIECSLFQLNKPFIFNLYSRGYSSSKVEIFIKSSTNSNSPEILTFKHIINRFEGSSGVTSNVGYTYHDDETGVRTYRFWKKDNERYGWTASNVECYADYMKIVSFGGGVSLEEPEGIVWADILYDNVSTSDVSKWNAKQDALTTQTAYYAKGSATKVPKITTNALGQVTNIEEVTITQPDVSGKANDTAVVHLSGTETVTGVKTFSNSTTNIVNPQATDVTRFRVFKPGETNLNGGVRLQLEYDPDGGRGLWDSNISEYDGNVLWIDASGQVRLHGMADYASTYAEFGEVDSGVAIRNALPRFFSKEFGLINLWALQENKVANLLRLSGQQAGFLFWTVQLENVPVDMVITFTVFKSNREWTGGEEHSSASLYVKSGNSTVSFITQYSYNVDDSGIRWYYLSAFPRSSYSGEISCRATCFRLVGAVQRFGGPWY